MEARKVGRKPAGQAGDWHVEIALYPSTSEGLAFAHVVGLASKKVDTSEWPVPSLRLRDHYSGWPCFGNTKNQRYITTRSKQTIANPALSACYRKYVYGYLVQYLFVSFSHSSTKNLEPTTQATQPPLLRFSLFIAGLCVNALFS